MECVTLLDVIFITSQKWFSSYAGCWCLFDFILLFSMYLFIIFSILHEVTT